MKNIALKFKNFWKIKRNQKTMALFFVLFVSVGLSVTFVSVHAGEFLNDIINGLISVVSQILFWLARLCMDVTLWSWEYFIELAAYNDFMNAPPVTIGWVMIRDFANMFFIVALMVIAIGTVLGVEQYEWKKSLVKLIFAAIFINFSKLILQLVLDFAQILMDTFLVAFKGQSGGNLINIFRFDTLLEMTRNRDISNSSLRFDLFIGAVVSFIMALLVMLTMGAYLIVMIGRMIVLWMLMILSPLAFVLSAFPFGKGYSSEFWKNFFNYAMVGPVMVFFTWLAFASLQSANIASDINLQVSKLTQAGSTSGDPSISASAASTWESLASYFIALGFFIVGIQMVGRMGVVGGGLTSKAMDFTKKAATIASGYAAGRWLVDKGLEKGDRALKGVGGYAKGTARLAYSKTGISDKLHEKRMDPKSRLGQFMNIPQRRRNALSRLDELKEAKGKEISATQGAGFWGASDEKLGRQLASTELAEQRKSAKKQRLKDSATKAFYREDMETDSKNHIEKIKAMVGIDISTALKDAGGNNELFDNLQKAITAGNYTDYEGAWKDIEKEMDDRFDYGQLQKAIDSGDGEEITKAVEVIKKKSPIMSVHQEIAGAISGDEKARIEMGELDMKIKAAESDEQIGVIADLKRVIGNTDLTEVDDKKQILDIIGDATQDSKREAVTNVVDLVKAGKFSVAEKSLDELERDHGVEAEDTAPIREAIRNAIKARESDEYDKVVKAIESGDWAEANSALSKISLPKDAGKLKLRENLQKSIFNADKDEADKALLDIGATLDKEESKEVAISAVQELEPKKDINYTKYKELEKAVNNDDLMTANSIIEGLESEGIMRAKMEKENYEEERIASAIDKMEKDKTVSPKIIRKYKKVQDLVRSGKGIEARKMIEKIEQTPELGLQSSLASFTTARTDKEREEALAGMRSSLSSMSTAAAPKQEALKEYKAKKREIDREAASGTRLISTILGGMYAEEERGSAKARMDEIQGMFKHSYLKLEQKEVEDKMVASNKKLVSKKKAGMTSADQEEAYIDYARQIKADQLMAELMDDIESGLRKAMNDKEGDGTWESLDVIDKNAKIAEQMKRAETKEKINKNKKETSEIKTSNQADEILEKVRKEKISKIDKEMIEKYGIDWAKNSTAVTEKEQKVHKIMESFPDTKEKVVDKYIVDSIDDKERSEAYERDGVYDNVAMLGGEYESYKAGTRGRKFITEYEKEKARLADVFRGIEGKSTDRLRMWEEKQAFQEFEDNKREYEQLERDIQKRYKQLQKLNEKEDKKDPNDRFTVADKKARESLSQSLSRDMAVFAKEYSGVIPGLSADLDSSFADVKVNTSENIGRVIAAIITGRKWDDVKDDAGFKEVEDEMHQRFKEKDSRLFRMLGQGLNSASRSLTSTESYMQVSEGVDEFGRRAFGMTNNMKAGAGKGKVLGTGTYQDGSTWREYQENMMARPSFSRYGIKDGRAYSVLQGGRAVRLKHEQAYEELMAIASKMTAEKIAQMEKTIFNGLTTGSTSDVAYDGKEFQVADEMKTTLALWMQQFANRYNALDAKDTIGRRQAIEAWRTGLEQLGVAKIKGEDVQKASIVELAEFANEKLNGQTVGKRTIVSDDVVIEINVEELKAKSEEKPGSPNSGKKNN
ncbi:MAG: hypothetical protein A2725_02040 [Candidatus Magasanikbacteria bacterium RIFCSPHIGHO2_01_FULL_33_34]|uniref:Uncharacterized protein n=1 Tax=Candidatus Magasanikbacteria bacterium RIFCSPHIGHO2_01_FULL_33_34 TaxID=1798671 RepID=A0A1F6LK82_9BACT|nr:MAG: hypothetical protein A2725_02040 [Candidatus Magasanikbacteria bacterium RIFCSPHIGHO2_01_FULL_33_34]OGH65550.1 MAG: hypothetical protein A3B83_01615 [Candidatus Magasanikbacteria bacterium RIFCSPHIGHO2_02_FULL_33_17]OGH76260.1 MAG: hypothetical protein A3A89_02435 [Candidatus Magasanikbacteria bacterium RIFCSPLOWO2_01_FULL_33_34]